MFVNKRTSVYCTHFDIVIRKHSFLAVFKPFHPSVGHGFDVGDYVTFLQRQLVRLAGHIIELDHSLCAHTHTRPVISRSS